MSVVGLTEQEKKVVHECLNAAAYGPFFIDNDVKDPFVEIHSLFGLFMNELRAIADKWPNVKMDSEEVRLAINNSMNNLLGCPHGVYAEAWSKYISVSPEELSRIFMKWREGNMKTER